MADDDQYGSQRFETGGKNRNNFWLALITFDEGWHNNHHYYPGTVRQGFYWWEIDLTYYGLKILEKLGLIWKLKDVPECVYARAESWRVTEEDRRTLNHPYPGKKQVEHNLQG